MSAATASHLDDERLSAVLDGAADPAEDRHASGCPTCGGRLEAWRATRQRMVGLGDERAQRMLESRRDPIVGAVLERASKPSRARRRRTRLAGAAILAAVAAGAAGGAAIVSGGGSPPHRAPRVATMDLAPVGTTVALIGEMVPRQPGSASGPLLRPTVTSPPAGPALSCLGPARRSAPPGWSAYRQARLRYRAVPAQAFLFTGTTGRVLVVDGQAGCRVLASASF